MATGYRTKSIVITSLDDQNLNITLKSNDEKNDPPPSCGCGKSLGAISGSGKFNIASAGRNTQNGAILVCGQTAVILK